MNLAKQVRAWAASALAQVPATILIEDRSQFTSDQRPLVNIKISEWAHEAEADRMTHIQGVAVLMMLECQAEDAVEADLADALDDLAQACHDVLRAAEDTFPGETFVRQAGEMEIDLVASTPVGQSVVTYSCSGTEAW